MVGRIRTAAVPGPRKGALAALLALAVGATGAALPGTAAGSGSEPTTSVLVRELAPATDAAERAVAALGGRVEIAAGTIETLAGRRVGRLQLDLPVGEVDGALARLAAAGVHAEVTR